MCDVSGVGLKTREQLALHNERFFQSVVRDHQISLVYGRRECLRTRNQGLQTRAEYISQMREACRITIQQRHLSAHADGNEMQPSHEETRCHMNAGEICDREVVVAYRNMTVTEAAKLMREHHVGSVVVVVDRLSERGPVLTHSGAPARG